MENDDGLVTGINGYNALLVSQRNRIDVAKLHNWNEENECTQNLKKKSLSTVLSAAVKKKMKRK